MYKITKCTCFIFYISNYQYIICYVILFPHCHKAFTLTKKSVAQKGIKGRSSDAILFGSGNFIAMGTGEVFLRSPGTGSNGRNNCFCLSSSALQTSANIAACHLCDFHATATRPHATAQKLRMWKRPLIARGDHS